MCHSPSGAFRVQAPDRACWALADNATATDNPAASPPDTTFCATRFISDLREKGDSSYSLPSVLPDRSGGDVGVSESRPGPGIRTDCSNAAAAGGPRSTVGSIHRRSVL